MVANIGEEFGLMVPMMKRMWWGAEAPRWTTPLPIPVKYVRFTQTGTRRCMNKESCCEMLRNAQKFYMEEVGLPDIPFNFMIGSECLIYKGRGWFYEADRPPDLSWLTGQCLDIAFIGNFEVRPLDEKVLRRAYDLITYGIKKEMIDPNYKLIQLGVNPTDPF